MFFCCRKKGLINEHIISKLVISEKELSLINNCEKFMDDCALCLEPLLDNKCMYTYKCLHVFHYECFRKYIHESCKLDYNIFCPLCYEKQTMLLN